MRYDRPFHYNYIVTRGRFPFDMFVVMDWVK